MFTIFRRPKPQYAVGQIVLVPGKEAGAGYYMQIQERKWVRQGGYTRWDWFYIGQTFEAKGTSLSPRSKEESRREDELGNISWFD